MQFRCGCSSPLRRDVWVLCVRAGIAYVSVGMSGLCRLFFICADGKKTALVRAVRTFLIAADRENGNNFVKLKSVSSR